MLSRIVQPYHSLENQVQKYDIFCILMPKKIRFNANKQIISPIILRHGAPCCAVRHLGTALAKWRGEKKFGGASFIAYFCHTCIGQWHIR